MHFLTTGFLLFICSTTFISISSTFAVRPPVIGILAQGEGCKLSKYSGYSSIIAASYVKYLESSGAQVVPIMIGQSREYYENLLNRINGVLFPGGSTSFDLFNDYADAGEIIYDIAKKLNDNGDYFPIWGTCLGFELLTYLAANRTKHRKSNCTSMNEALKLEFAPRFHLSKMFREAPNDIIDILRNEDVTYNYHKFCITKKSLENVNLENDFHITSYGYAEYGTKFISSLEHVKYPFYGVQFHPEKNVFEWKYELNIPHTKNAIKITRFFGDFFVNEARKNNHRYNRDQLQKDLIYNYALEHTALKGSVFEQCYMFRPRPIER